jgi:hypothetical protein
MLILFLAANTSYADFPRLCYFLAKDKFMPNRFKQLGDRLVFTNGIIALGGVASLLIILFNGDVHLLIPLYAVGVFTSFTLSQAGMVLKNTRIKPQKWKRKAFTNAFGALMTITALIIIAATKFLSGAWIIVLFIPLMIIAFKKIHTHYTLLAEQLSLDGTPAPLKLKTENHLMIVLVPTFHKGIIQALEFAKSFSKNAIALHIGMSGSESEKLKEKWNKYKPGIRLVMIESPYRRIIQPLNEYLDKLEFKDKNLHVTILIPEFVPKKWWQFFLHNQTALALKAVIHFRPRTSYISIQYHLEK